MIIVTMSATWSPHLKLRGHDVSFHATLRSSANHSGLTAYTLVPTSASAFVEDGEIPILRDPADMRKCTTDIKRWLEDLPPEQNVAFILYEGSTEWLAAVSSLAQSFPQHAFICNLFHPEPTLITPRFSGESLRLPLLAAPISDEAFTARHFTGINIPSNVRLMAETETRAFLAQSLGLPVEDVWPLHSILAVPGTRAQTRKRDDSAVRILIPLAARQIDRRVMSDLRFVISQSSRGHAGGALKWTIAGALDHRPSAMSAVMTLQSDDVTVRPEAADALDYASQFWNHDAAWFPVRGTYTTQSSGKVLDALVSGLPIVAPAGSFAVSEQRKWVPGAPAYDGRREAVEIFLRLPSLRAHWQNELLRSHDAIVHHYSADRAVSLLVKLATSERPRQQTLSLFQAGASPSGSVQGDLASRIQYLKHALLELFDAARSFKSV